MTSDEILALPAGPALDRLVAEKVMGGRFDGDTLTDGKRCWPVPPYSINIAAAWEVVEKLNAAGKNVCVSRTAKGECEALVSTCFEDHVHGEGETAPLAICRACLLAALVTES